MKIVNNITLSTSLLISIFLQSCAMSFSVELSGQVMDKETLQPINNAEVYMKNYAYSSVSDTSYITAQVDTSGNFTIISLNIYNRVIIKCPGYKTKKVKVEKPDQSIYLKKTKKMTSYNNINSHKVE